MKKFKFSLDVVLSYKQQVLESVQNEYAECQAAVIRQEEVLEAVWESYHSYNAEFREKKAVGMTITDALIYENGLRVLENEIAIETRRLEELEELAEKKRLEMVEAKKETASLEKLRERKLEAYEKAVQKGEEQLVEEFVATTRAVSRSTV